MLNNPLLKLLISAFVSAALGWLINQLPPIREFPGRSTLTLRLTLEVLMLGVLLQVLPDTSLVPESTQKFANIFVVVVLMLLALDLFHL